MPPPARLAPVPVIDDRKVVDYLLNPDHPEGGPKAAYFIRRGFRREDPRDFIDALFAHGTDANLVSTARNAFGTVTVYEAPLRTPDGVHPRVRSVWQNADGDHARLLVTAYMV